MKHTLLSDCVPPDGAKSSEATERDNRLRSACLTREAESAMRSLGTLYSSQRRWSAVICASLSASASDRRLTRLIAPWWSSTPWRTALSAAESARGSSAFTAGRSSNMVGSDPSSRPYICSAMVGDDAVVGDAGGGSGKEVRESVSSCGANMGRRLDALLSSPILSLTRAVVIDGKVSRVVHVLWLLLFCPFRQSVCTTALDWADDAAAQRHMHGGVSPRTLRQR